MSLKPILFSFKVLIIAAVLLLFGLFVSLRLVLERVAVAPAFKAWIEKEVSGALLRPVDIGKIELTGWPNLVLAGKNVRLWEDSSRRRLIIEAPEADVSLSLSSVLSLALGLSEIKLVRPNIFFRQSEKGEWNFVRAADDIDAASNEPGTAVVKVLFKRFTVEDGTLSTQNMYSHPGPLPPLKINGHGRLMFNGRFNFQINSRLAESSSTVKLPLGIDETAALTITGFYVPRSTSTFTGVLSSSSTYAALKCGVNFSPQVTAAIDIQNARYLSTNARNVRAMVRREGGDYKIDVSSFQVLGGAVEAHADYLTSVSTDSLSVAWKSSGIQVRDLFDITGSSLEISGVLDSDGQISGILGKSFLPSMNGEIRFDLKKGWFGNAKGLLKVLTDLNITTVISETERKKRVPFDDTHGKLKIVNGKVSTVEPIELENKTLQLIFMGSCDLSRQTVDGKIAVHFLLVTDEIINKVPILNYILLGDNKSVVPIWVSVKGKISDPEIKILSEKTITGPARSIIDNIFRLPKQMLDKVTNQ